MWAREVPYLKGVAMVGVILIHSIMYFTSIDGLSVLVEGAVTADIVSHFAVPLFVFASGLVLSIRYVGPFQKARFYRRRFAIILPPYLVFSTVYVAYSWWATGVSPSITSLLMDYLTGSAFFHLWFIALIAQLYLLFPYLVQVYDRFFAKSAFQIVVAAFALQMLYSVGILAFPPIANHGFALGLATRFFLGYLGYFVLGMYAGRNLDSVRRWTRSLPAVPLALIAGGVTATISAVWLGGIQRYGSYDMVPPSYLVLTPLLEPILYLPLFAILLKWAMLTRSAVARRFGTYSLWIYLVHPLFIVLNIQVLAGLGFTMESWLFYLIGFAAACTECWLSTVVLDYVPYSSLIGGPVGQRRPDGSEAVTAKVAPKPVETQLRIGRASSGWSGDQRDPPIPVEAESVTTSSRATRERTQPAGTTQMEAGEDRSRPAESRHS